MCLNGKALKWVNSYSKKQCKSIFRNMRKAVKEAGKKGTKRQPKFQYDPSSYALNFDDGCYHLRGGGRGGGAFAVKPANDQHGKIIVLVYVLVLS